MAGANLSTLVVHGRLAIRERRLAAGRDRHHGLQVMSLGQAAVRPDGGFVRLIVRADGSRVIEIAPDGTMRLVRLTVAGPWPTMTPSCRG